MTDTPILDYGDELGKLLLFLAVCYAVVVGLRTWAHALTRENAAVALSRRAQRRRKTDQWHCVLCDGLTDITHAATIYTKQYGQYAAAYAAPLCADCHTIAPTGASPERAK